MMHQKSFQGSKISKKLNAIFFVPALNYKKIILNVHKVHILLATQDQSNFSKIKRIKYFKIH